MILTHSYLAFPDVYDYYFFLITRHFDEDKLFGELFETYLKRAARDLGTKGAIIRPFGEDYVGIQREVEEKWGEDGFRELSDNAPGLLITKTDFESFVPQEDEYLYISAHVDEGDTAKGVEDKVRLFGETLMRIVEITRDKERDFFREAKRIINRSKMQSIMSLEDVANVVIVIANKIVNITDVVGGQIQVDTIKSEQIIDTTVIQLEGLQELIDSLKRAVGEVGFSEEQQDELQSEITTLEAHASSPNTKSSIVKEALTSIRTIFEGAVGGGLVSAGKYLREIVKFVQNLP
jgi:hypothetical protein